MCSGEASNSLGPAQGHDSREPRARSTGLARKPGQHVTLLFWPRAASPYRNRPATGGRTPSPTAHRTVAHRAATEASECRLIRWRGDRAALQLEGLGTRACSASDLYTTIRLPPPVTHRTSYTRYSPALYRTSRRTPASSSSPRTETATRFRGIPDALRRIVQTFERGTSPRVVLAFFVPYRTVPYLCPSHTEHLDPSGP